MLDSAYHDGFSEEKQNHQLKQKRYNPVIILARAIFVFRIHSICYLFISQIPSFFFEKLPFILSLSDEKNQTASNVPMTIA